MPVGMTSVSTQAQLPGDSICSYVHALSIENKNAIERIYLIKRQRADKPFSFVCSDLTNISEYAHVSNAAFKIMKRLIPGPYTFILPAARMRQLPKILVSKRKTVGVITLIDGRPYVPDSLATLGIVRELGHPILSTSATTEDGEVVTDPEQFKELFNNVVDIILDGGVLASQQSTVLDLTGDEPVVVRKGAGDISALG